MESRMSRRQSLFDEVDMAPRWEHHSVDLQAKFDRQFLEVNELGLASKNRDITLEFLVYVWKRAKRLPE